MGWGLLDKKILLLTEDSKTELIRSAISQWPEIDRLVSIWPLHGSGKLLDAQGCNSLRKIFGSNVEIVLHRDRDFMMPEEAEAFCYSYDSNNIPVWLTEASDIESYWCNKEVISTHFNINEDEGLQILKEAFNNLTKDDVHLEKLRKKIKENLNKISNEFVGKVRMYSEKEVCDHYHKIGKQHVILGKDLLSEIRRIAQERKLERANVLGRSVPNSLSRPIMNDLESLLRRLCGS